MMMRFPSIFSFSKLAMVAVAAMVVFGAPGSVRADGSSVTKFLEAVDNGSESLSALENDLRKKTVANYIGFTGLGIFWANEEMKHKGGSGLYCLPDELALQPEQYISILRNYVKKYSFAGEMQMGLVLVQALKDVFPCK